MVCTVLKVPSVKSTAVAVVNVELGAAERKAGALETAAEPVSEPQS
jgi:hypothetical protein